MPLEHRHHARCACGSTLSTFASSAAASGRSFPLAGVKRVYERPRPFVIGHIALDWELDYPGRELRGSATLSLRRVDPEAEELRLDAVAFELRSVELCEGEGDFQALPYVYDGESLRIPLPRSAQAPTVRVQYAARPRRGLYFLAPDELVPQRPSQVWTQCQDEDARHLFPCHDKPHVKQTTELRVRVPQGWMALSNGKRLSDDEAARRGEWHYRLDQPHPSYLFTLVAGEFSTLEELDGPVPLTFHVPKGREEDARRTFARTRAMLELFGQKTGVPYPYERYAQVVVSDFIFGGMENTTASTLYEHVLVDERASLDITGDDLIAHELAHQWFGDLVTCRDWSHAWLNEGFATYFEHVDREHHLGRDAYDYSLLGDLQSYLSEARGRYRRPIVCQDYEAPVDLFDRHLYEKGGVVLHLLRTELGDELFWKGIGLYLRRHAHSVVETRDLQRALEEVSGRGLERFFEQWVHRPGHPEVEVKLSHEEGVLFVEVTQSQLPSASPPREAPEHVSVPTFAFDLVLELGLEGGRVLRERRRIDQAQQSFGIPLPSRPRFVVVDPELRILGEVSVEAPVDLLRQQLAEAPSARGRMLAAALLGKRYDPVTLRALEACLVREQEFWGVRAEAATALGELRSEEALQALRKATAVEHPKVRRAVAHALGQFRHPKAAEALRPLALRDPSYLVEAEAARALGSTRQPLAFDTLIDILDRPAWADVIRAGSVDGLAALRDERALPHVLARIRYGVSTRGRRAAILALPKLSSDRRTREALEELLDDPDPVLRVDVVRALLDLGDPKSRAALQRQLGRETDGRVRRRLREALRDLGGSAKRENERLRDEIEKLGRAQGELQSRLAKLEAKLLATDKGAGPS